MNRKNRSRNRAGGRTNRTRRPPTQKRGDAVQYIRLKELARSAADRIPPDDALHDDEATAGAIESALFSTLDLVAAVRAAPEPPQAGRTLTGELELAGSPGAMTLLLLLRTLGGMPYLRDMAGKSVKSLAKRGVRSTSESLVVSLTEPEPLAAWKLDDEDGVPTALWCAVTGSDGGARVLEVVIENERAASATLDCLPAAQDAGRRVLETAPSDLGEPASLEWDEARRLLADVWDTGSPQAAGPTEATYLRPWVERSILRGMKPSARSRPDEAAPPPPPSAPPALVAGALRTLGGSDEHVEMARHVWADFVASFSGEIPADQLDDWAASAVLAVVQLSEAGWSMAAVAKACGRTEDDLMELHEEFWEIMDVEVPEDQLDDDAGEDDLLQLRPPGGEPRN